MAAVEAAEQAGFTLARQVSIGVGEDSIKSGAGLRAREMLFADTQTAFEEILGRMSAGSPFVPDRWVEELRRAALSIFDAEVTPGLADLGEARRTAAIEARKRLIAAFAGKGAAGKKIFDALGFRAASAQDEWRRGEHDGGPVDRRDLHELVEEQHRRRDGRREAVEG